MAIKDISEIRRGKTKIDLTGPAGNAFALLGFAEELARKIGKDPKDILERMKSSDYENLIQVFNSEFGHLVDLYR